ncbi:hypothetical protein PENSOL_c046G07246 [Penicillium solitum]|uniref:Uncharacterized protein n=1 Tax=Penicillium solitum TaxID=60172 RepID=A0A1V6QRX2_9EURO|nr:uncharacterized protein PENSOL_c046G07246 [Penicillium solitum]OQD91973.1 hypothetical protein PENSOL_c046G07246 [Penicillium solitum]
MALRKGWHWTDLVAFLGIVVQAATGCRVGEIVRSPGYLGLEFLAWGDVDLHFRTEKKTTPTVNDLKCIIKVRYNKGSKRSPTDILLKRIDLDQAPKPQMINNSLKAMGDAAGGKSSTTGYDRTEEISAWHDEGKKKFNWQNWYTELMERPSQVLRASSFWLNKYEDLGLNPQGCLVLNSNGTFVAQEQHVPHTCIGTADYSLLFGEKDHIACHMVIIEAKRRGCFPDQG